MRTGQLVELVASVVRVGRSSMTVEVEMTAEDPLTGDRRICTTGRFVMIALDANGSATAVPNVAGCRLKAAPQAGHAHHGNAAAKILLRAEATSKNRFQGRNRFRYRQSSATFTPHAAALRLKCSA